MGIYQHYDNGSWRIWRDGWHGASHESSLGRGVGMTCGVSAQKRWREGTVYAIIFAQTLMKLAMNWKYKPVNTQGSDTPNVHIVDSYPIASKSYHPIHQIPIPFKQTTNTTNAYYRYPMIVV